MPWSDFFLVLQWWGTLFLVGAAAFPLTKRLFGGWYDHGYFFSKAVGMAVAGWVVYAAGTLHILAFTTTSIVVSLVLLLVLGILVNLKFSIFTFQSISNFKFQIENSRKNLIERGSIVFWEEFFFLAMILVWSWVKGHEPSIRGLEKFMDYGFMKSILESSFFPPADMWYAGSSINYYYFGHLVTAVLTKLSGLDLAYTFNLMLATLFVLTATMSFSIGYQLMSNKREAIREKHENEKPRSFLSLISYRLFPFFAGLLTSFLVTLAGNLQTLYAFTAGYTGDDVRPFWQLLWPLGEFFQKLPEGLSRYWYANATRFIPFTIHEFPSYSFVVSDVHGHVLSIPFVLLAIALLIALVLRLKSHNWLILGFYGFLVGVLLMTNALDGPIYFVLLTALLAIGNWGMWRELGKRVSIIAGIAGITSLPFLFHFNSFVSGIAVNCPPAFLANTKIGPFIFEGVEKCQRSPLWMWWLLWGFFLYSGMGLIIAKLKIKTLNFKLSKTIHMNTEIPLIEKLLIIFFVFALALVIFPEFFYFKDIYPAHFRSNTMFKLGYQAFILFSIVSGYTIVRLLFSQSQDIKYTYQKLKRVKAIFLIFLLPQLFFVSIYPIFSVRSYFNGLKNYERLNGLGWLEQEYPDDYAAIEWLNGQKEKGKREALVEADGDSYTDYNRFSAFTGIPTIVGWAVHEWLWRGSYDVVAPRREEVRLIYESENLKETREILRRYNVGYVVVGSLERQKFQNLVEWKFSELGSEAFRSSDTVIYQITINSSMN